MGLGDHLRKLREEKGWSQRSAAKALGVSYTRLSEVESGVSRSSKLPTVPGVEFLVKASRGYGVPLPSLLEMAGMVNDEVDRHQEAELIELWRGLSPQNRSMAVAIVRVMRAQEHQD